MAAPIRAVRFYEYGGPEVLRLEQVQPAAPGPDEVQVRIEAIGLNRAEVFFRQGWHPIKPAFPSRIGTEAAGIVQTVGEEVTDFTVGDRVATLPVMEVNTYGAYGEAITIPARLLVRSPPELSALEAAALWNSYMTAYGALVELVAIKPGDIVLCNAGSSSIAVAAIQIINMLGGKPVAVTRKRIKADIINGLGAYDVIATDEEDVVQRVRHLSGGKGAPVVFDPIGGLAFEKMIEAAAPYGTVILYGATDRAPTPLPVIPVVSKNLAVLGYAMLLGDKSERDLRAIKFIREGVARRMLKPYVGCRFDFDEIVEALRYLDSMNHVGKIVIDVRGQ